MLFSTSVCYFWLTVFWCFSPPSKHPTKKIDIRHCTIVISHGGTCHRHKCTCIYEVICENRLKEGQTEQDLIRRHAFCAASDQSLDFLSNMSICRKHISLLVFYTNLKLIQAMNISIGKSLVQENTVCSTINRIFADDVAQSAFYGKT